MLTIKFFKSLSALLLKLPSQDADKMKTVHCIEAK